jgi:hypothetical protein
MPANTSIPLETPKIPPQTDAHLVLLHVFQAKLTHRGFLLIIPEMKNTKITFLPVEPPSKFLSFQIKLTDILI